MLKVIAYILFVLALLVDVVMVVLKCVGWIPWSWTVVLLAPFAIAIALWLGFAIFYGLIAIFVRLAMW